MSVLTFSESRVRNSVLRGVSMTVSYSFKTCSTTKSSWNGLKREEGGMERDGERERGRDGERERGRDEWMDT